MISFRLTFVLCALVFGQSLASTIQSSTAVESKQLDVIIKIVHILEKVGDTALDIATKVVDYCIKHVHDLPKQVAAYAEKYMKKISDIVIKVLEKVEKVANPDAAIVVKCAESANKAFVADYALTVRTALDCVDPSMEKVLAILPDVLKQLGDILAKVEGVTDNLKKCAGGPIKELTCVLDITNKSLAEAKDLSKVVIDAYHHIKSALFDMYSKSEKCLHGVLDKIIKDALTRLNNFGTCSRKPSK
nr:unnamed protein product [Callosobruchus analis]